MFKKCRNAEMHLECPKGISEQSPVTCTITIRIGGPSGANVGPIEMRRELEKVNGESREAKAGSEICKD